MENKSGAELLIIFISSTIGIFVLPIAIMNLIANVNDYWSWVIGLSAFSMLTLK